MNILVIIVRMPGDAKKLARHLAGVRLVISSVQAQVKGPCGSE